jgi:GT2 family glycosyltransferase
LIQNRWNAGYAYGINQGLREAGDNAVLILGPDARLLDHAVDHLFKGFGGESDIAMVAPQHIDKTGKIMPSCRRLPRYRDLLYELTGLPRLFPKVHTAGWKMPEFDHNKEQQVEQPEATCWLIHPDLLKRGFRMDERFPLFFNDVDWCYRLKESGLKILFIPDAKIEHEGGESVLQQPIPMIWKSHQGFYRYFAKIHSNGVMMAANHLLALLLITAATIRSLIRLLYKGTT